MIAARGLALGLALAAGCGPNLYALSTPPPGRAGWLDSGERTLELSAGVAIAFACEQRGPCKGARATSDDPRIAEVVPAHLARLEARYDPMAVTSSSMVPTASFLVIARAPGTTTIHVRSEDGDRDLAVTVQPDPSRPAVAARGAGPATP